MPSNHQLKTLVGLAVLLWVILLLSQGQPVTMKMLAPYSFEVTGLSFAILLCERRLWPWWIFRGLVE
jgi:hypothetical protein